MVYRKRSFFGHLLSQSHCLFLWKGLLLGHVYWWNIPDSREYLTSALCLNKRGPPCIRPAQGHTPSVAKALLSIPNQATDPKTLDLIVQVISSFLSGTPPAWNSKLVWSCKEDTGGQRRTGFPDTYTSAWRGEECKHRQSGPGYI